MKKHIFLTGDIQVGKSTAIRKALAMLGCSVGGFRTSGTNYQADGSSDVVIYAASASPESGYRVAHRSATTGISVYPEIFDEFGTYYLQQPGTILLMDELGYMESKALKFQEAVFAALDGTTPVLGVIRNRDTPFLNIVRKRDDVIVLTVTEANRDIIPNKISYFFKNLLQ